MYACTSAQDLHDLATIDLFLYLLSEAERKVTDITKIVLAKGHRHYERYMYMYMCTHDYKTS